MPSRFDSTSARRVTLGGESRVVRVFMARIDRRRDVPPPRREVPAPRRDAPAPPAPPREKESDDAIDVASEESFPASDPPSFTSSRA